MIRLITFTDSNMTISAERLKESALKFGVDSVFTYSPYLFDQSFEYLIKPLLKDSRGYGWWLWKPYILLDAIQTLKDGDILIYSDAGQEVIADLRSMTELMDEDIMFFTNGFQHSHWCKMEVMEAICPEFFPEKNWPDNNYQDYKQVQASFIFFKVNESTRKFIQEWYAWSIMPGLIDNTPRGEQFPEFAEHRHDQAILTCLQIKYGYKLHWFPSTTNMHRQPPEIGIYNEKYGIKLIHHRMRNNEY